jgi:hypothetical protein
LNVYLQRSEGSGRRRRVLVVLAAFLLALSAASVAAAELTQKGDLFVKFDGGISPRSLPRRIPAPIAVRIEGTIRIPRGAESPSLSRMRIALHRNGRLETRGLPVCRRRELVAASAAEALAACGSALVGSGGIVANTDFAGQATHLFRSGVILFNGAEAGRPVIFAHVFEPSPPVSHVVTFQIRRGGGTFGTVITAELPPALQHNAYLKSIFLRLQRRYVFRGRARSYLSANCAAPAGFSLASFPFAKASMTFDDGRVLSATLIRSCRVAG